MSKKKTHEQYVAEVAIKNPNIKIIGKYINANTPNFKNVEEELNDFLFI